MQQPKYRPREAGPYLDGASPRFLLRGTLCATSLEGAEGAQERAEGPQQLSLLINQTTLVVTDPNKGDIMTTDPMAIEANEGFQAILDFNARAEALAPVLSSTPTDTALVSTPPIQKETTMNNLDKVTTARFPVSDVIPERACLTLKGKPCRHGSANIRVSCPGGKYAYLCAKHFDALKKGNTPNFNTELVLTEAEWAARRAANYETNTAGADGPRQLSIPTKGTALVSTNTNTKGDTTMKTYHLVCSGCERKFVTQDRAKLEALKARGGLCKVCFGSTATPKATVKAQVRTTNKGEAKSLSPEVAADPTIRKATCQHWTGKGKCSAKIEGTIAQIVAWNNRCEDHR